MLKAKVSLSGKAPRFWFDDSAKPYAFVPLLFSPKRHVVAFLAGGGSLEIFSHLPFFLTFVNLVV